MTFVNIFLLEWKHFIRSPYKVIAIFLFILASVYGIHNSVSLYQTQINEIAKIEERVSEERQEFVKKHLAEMLAPIKIITQETIPHLIGHYVNFPFIILRNHHHLWFLALGRASSMVSIKELPLIVAPMIMICLRKLLIQNVYK